MILAAISFSDPVMLVGLLAAAIPIALHLLNRIRSPVVPFPTLRFLKITAQKTSRRRQVQQYFLLLLRMAVFAMIAMAVAHPLIRGGSASVAYALLGTLLGGLAMLVLAGVWGAAAIDKAKSRPAGTDESRPTAPERPAKYWGLAAAALMLAIALTGFSLFGFTSNAYFSGDAGAFSGRSTAAVIVFDNSHSMLARQDGTARLDTAKREVRRILVETIRPAEAAILPTNAGASAVGESLTGDMTSLVGYLDKLQPVGRARSMKERIHAAATLLAGSTEGNRMLILVSDMAGPAFSDAEVFNGLKESGAKDVQLVLMQPGGAAPVEDVGIASFGIAEGAGAAVLGTEVTFDAQIVNSGDAAAAMEWELLVDGKPVANPAAAVSTVQLPAATTAAARATIRVPCRLEQAGPHAFTLRLKEPRDAMQWDDARTLVLDVAKQARVLVIGADPASRGPRPRSAAFYFMAALAPFEGSELRDAAEKPIPWAIQPAYRSADDITSPAQLAGYSAVFICDVPKVSARMADSLTRYVGAGDGGRIIWVLGPSVNAAGYNNLLASRGLLPAPLGDPIVTATGATLDWVDLQSDIFANLFDSQEPFRSAVVTGRWSLAPGEMHGRALGKLADGQVVLTEHAGPGGVGDIYTLLTSPGSAWSNLGSTVLLVPMASRMALGDSGRSRTALSYEPGDSVPIRIASAESLPAPAISRLTVDVTTPENTVVNARPALSAGAPRWPLDHTRSEGMYHWRSTDGKYAGMFAVNPPGEEADLHAANTEELAREAAAAAGSGSGRAPIVATTAGELLAQLDKRSEGTSLTPGVLAMVMILAVIEALMANRYRPAEPMQAHNSPQPSTRGSRAAA
ncbi:MAG TPA: BatA domain-containing protein [Phycisphaerae bacterium]|nr:BatA domain-containing protein [Phycisphaerae bacterium]